MCKQGDGRERGRGTSTVWHQVGAEIWELGAPEVEGAAGVTLSRGQSCSQLLWAAEKSSAPPRDGWLQAESRPAPSGEAAHGFLAEIVILNETPNLGRASESWAPAWPEAEGQTWDDVAPWETGWIFHLRNSCVSNMNFIFILSHCPEMSEISIIAQTGKTPWELCVFSLFLSHTESISPLNNYCQSWIRACQHYRKESNPFLQTFKTNMTSLCWFFS